MTNDKVFYSSVEDVVRTTGVRYEDLGFENDLTLRQWIADRLEEIKDLVDQDRNRDYAQEAAAGDRDKVPPGIHGIALRIMSNLIGQAIVRRTSPIVRVDDLAIRITEDQVFTKAIKDDLKRYPAKPRFSFMTISKKDDA